MHYYLADREAANRSPGARAIVLDQNGHIAESTTANVLVYREGEGLISPPLEHILVGVSLGVMKELAAVLNVPFNMRPLTVDDFRTSDEAMLTSTSICLLPIVECDGRPIGKGAAGASLSTVACRLGKPRRSRRGSAGKTVCQSLCVTSLASRTRRPNQAAPRLWRSVWIGRLGILVITAAGCRERRQRPTIA